MATHILQCLIVNFGLLLGSTCFASGSDETPVTVSVPDVAASSPPSLHIDSGAGVFPSHWLDAGREDRDVAPCVSVRDEAAAAADSAPEASRTSLFEDDATPTATLRHMMTPASHVLAPYPKHRRPNRPIFILSIDGGGIRGCIPAVQLCYLSSIIEARHNLNLPRVFDVIAGTSTGGLIAAALSMAKADGITPAMTVPEISAFYTAENASRIFSASRWHKFWTWGGVWGSRYEPEGLEGLLRTHLGDAWLSQGLTNTLVTAVNMDTDEVYTFSRHQARETPSMDFRLADICRATSAAPTFFPGAMILDRERSPHAFIDGGVRKNNPAGLALDLAEDLYPEAPAYILLSLGTGEKVAGEHGYEQTASAGKLGWARPLIDIMMYGSSRDTDFDMARRLPPKMVADVATTQYYRTQPLLPRELSAMDATDPETIARLRALGDPTHNREIRVTLDHFAETVGRYFPRLAART